MTKITMVRIRNLLDLVAMTPQTHLLHLGKARWPC